MAPTLGFLYKRATAQSSTAAVFDSIANINARDVLSVVATPTENGLETRTEMARRDETTTHVGGAGTVAPQSINNKAMFALFALLGVGMVVSSLWFFFWAKNGGFQWRETDWDDYKSTVLRRKGPDGKTLSNATKSTRLGGGTIAGTQYYDFQKSIARSVVGRDEKGRKGVLGRRGWGGTHSVLYDNDYMTETFGTRTRGTRTVVTDEMTELRSELDHPGTPGGGENHHSHRYRDRDVREYKKERPARVGGINRVPDGSHFDYTNSERSEILTASVISDGSTQPMIKKTPDEKKRREEERAERRAREEAARMERRWKREAEEAAAMLARENQRPAPAMTKRSSAVPAAASRPFIPKQQDRKASSPQRKQHRDFSYTDGPESEILSTAYTGSSGHRSASYYDEYRPGHSAPSESGTRYYTTERRAPSPKKKHQPPRGGTGGYRRGGNDSDLE